MLNFKRTVITGLAVLTVLLTSACTSTPDETPKTDSDPVITAYTEFIDASVNHGKEADFFETINLGLSEALGSDGTNYEAGLAVLTDNKVPLDAIYIPETTEGTEGVPAFTSGLRLFSLMSNNMIGDKVTVKIDPNGVRINEGGVAEIDKTAITFSSKDNTTTALGDTLNNYYGKTSAENSNSDVVVLQLDSKGVYKVDMLTVN